MIFSAYFYQAINICVVIIMVPMLLHYLDVEGFLLWSIFTTFGGVTLQIESAIQNVSMREISKEFHSGGKLSFDRILRKTRVAYLKLSLSVAFIFSIIGGLYIYFILAEKVGYNGILEWLMFITGYAINYYFGRNNSILLGMKAIKEFNNINSFTRVIYLISTFVMLENGYSVFGICLSFLLSVVIGCFLISNAARRTVDSFYKLADNIKGNDILATDDSGSSQIVRYTFYMFASFLLYKGILLLVVVFFPKEVAAAYGLSIQVFTLVSTLALVPLQVWLHRLVSAITKDDKGEIVRELGRSIIVVNGIFVSGFIGVLLLGNLLLSIIGSRILLIETFELFLFSIAFIVELNIFLIANFLVLKRNLKFVNLYLMTSGLGIVAVLILTSIYQNLALLILVPVLIQVLVMLPRMVTTVSRELELTPRRLLVEMAKVKILL